MQLFAKVARSTVQKLLFSAQSSMQFYAKSDKLLHIEHPLKVRFVETADVLQVADETLVKLEGTDDGGFGEIRKGKLLDVGDHPFAILLVEVHAIARQGHSCILKSVGRP